MSLTHQAPSGMTFVLRSVENIPERKRRAVVNKFMGGGLAIKDSLDEDAMKAAIDAQAAGQEIDEQALRKAITPESLQAMDVLDEVNDLLAVAMLLSWSAEAEITLDALLDLPSGDYKAIRIAVAPSLLKLMPDFDVDPDKESPSEP